MSVSVFSQFAGKVYERMADLEASSDRVHGLLFVDTEERPSLASLSKTVDTHIKAMCGWARAARWLILIVSTIFAFIVAAAAALRVIGIL